MQKETNSLPRIISRWLEKKAETYAGQRCIRQYHQPKVPKGLKQKT